MPRSSFFQSSSSHDRDQSPLLPEHRDSVSLRELSPRSSHQSSRRVSPSPPPSFYRDLNTTPSRADNQSYTQSLSPSPSPSRTRPKRTIQFSAPPPPIATSLLLPARQAPQRGSTKGRQEYGLSAGTQGAHVARRASGVDPLVVLERREKAIHQDLQFLLDAQSAGLLHGSGAGETESDAGSSTPTSKSMMGGRRGSGSQGRSGGNRGIVPVRQPKSRTIGLRSARRGLLREMSELAAIKGEELDVLDGEVEKREDVLKKVGAWQKRIESVEVQLNTTAPTSNEEEREITELQNEEKAVENEIRELEDRLASMKARQRWLGERIKEGVNRREARLSSYRGALREAESEVKEFLRRPPISTSILMSDEEGFAALPPGRRTLEMARDWWAREISKLRSRREKVSTEKQALEEGAALWNDSINTVAAFEDDLRKQMSVASGSQAAPQGLDVLRNQIAKMHIVIGKLEISAKIAEERSWNLLICATGAELEAFRQGVLILQGALDGASVEGTVENENGSVKEQDGKSDGIEDLNGQQFVRQESMEREESEDDGPNLAELLVDKGES